MKKALVIALVLVIVLAGVPLLMPMSGMARCPDCGPGVVSPGACLAVLLAFSALVVLMGGSVLRVRRRPSADLLQTFFLERPPQLV